MIAAQNLLDVLRCPVTRRPLRMMSTRELGDLNAAIRDGKVRYAHGGPVTSELEGGVATVDGSARYPIEGEVPALVPELRIGAALGAVATADRDPEAEATLERFWERLSLRWNHRTPPARPAPEDTAVLERFVADALAAAGRTAASALMLGVTPEIATMRWPAGTRLLALDASAPMIRNVWPAREVPDGAAVRGVWSAMPAGDGAFDVVVGDASLGIQRYPGPFFAVVAEVRRVLRAGGVLAMRVFTRPEENEPVESVFADLRAGRIRNLDTFRWRLAAALHGDRARGALQREMWDAWEANVSDPQALVAALGWPPETIAVMENARGNDVAMIFPTAGELRADLAADFEEVACEIPPYQDGERYPTFMFRARPRSGNGGHP